MAIDQGTKTLAIKTEERTWRINIETPKDAEPVVTVFREIVRTAPDGSVISKEPADGSVERRLSSVASQSFTVSGRTHTVGEIAGVIAAVADTWRQEDIAAKSAENEG